MTRTITSHVRGGGVGGSAWVAKIVGPNDKYGFERQFVRKTKNLSGSGRSGTIQFELAEPGIYEYRDVQHPAGVASIGSLDSGFIELLSDGTTRELSRDEAKAAIK